MVDPCWSIGWFIKYIWLVVYLPLWKMMEFVSWDDDIPNWMEKWNNIWNHQPDILVFQLLTIINQYMGK